jgi:hypothetical protein
MAEQWQPSWRTNGHKKPADVQQPAHINHLSRPTTANSIKSKDLAQRILYHTKNTEVLVQTLVALAEGQIEGTKPSDQIRAIEVLLDRVLGKAPAIIDIQGEIVHKSVSDFSDDELRSLVDLRKRIIDGEAKPIDDNE